MMPIQPEANLRIAEGLLSFDSARHGRLCGMRILIVEDEERLAASIARGLIAEGYSADVVNNGVDGLWQAQEVDYAAIILDIMLPGKNGYEVCRELRASGTATPILMLTAKDGEYDEAEALDMGADDYLRKPFSLVVLHARLRVLVRRGVAPVDSKLTVQGLTLDRGRLRCVTPNDEVELTPREFAVLELLARRAPDVVPKSSLLDAVWGLDFDGDPNIVEVYVGYLRRKLGKSAVRTVRGAGYQLVGAER